VRIGALLLALCAWIPRALAGESQTIEHKTTLAELFPDGTALVVCDVRE